MLGNENIFDVYFSAKNFEQTEFIDLCKQYSKTTIISPDVNELELGEIFEILLASTVINIDTRACIEEIEKRLTFANIFVLLNFLLDKKSDQIGKENFKKLTEICKKIGIAHQKDLKEEHLLAFGKLFFYL